MDIIVSKNGQIRFVYNDALLGLTEEGISTVSRASHVEPCDNGWEADMSPVEGPVLGPFKTRAEALQKEVAWLLQHNIPRPIEA